MSEFDVSKLKYHPDYISKYLSADPLLPPFYVEISPGGYCNHRCEFCALDFLNYRSQYLSTEVLMNLKDDLASIGVTGIMWGGEGEPTLVRDLPRVIAATSLHQALTTNGVYYTREFADVAQAHLDWIKFSVDAGHPETYMMVHRCNSDNWEKLWENIEYAVSLKTRTSLAVQILLYNQGLDEVEMLAEKCSEAGIKKLIVKPYSKHPHSIHLIRLDDSLWTPNAIRIMRGFSDDDLEVSVRDETMQCGQHPMPYHMCHCTPWIWAYVQSNGTVWSCSARLGEDEFRLGNILDKPFSAIWHERDRTPHIDTKLCRRMCRMDPTNRYLEELRRPTVSSIYFP